ncbi:MAG: DUF4242 domain-containing protein [Flavobacteriaceae bacterium]|nr:DUF4242 domain-containing protein [Flavobacteriaceae bacterium]
MDRHNLPGVTLQDAADAHHKDVELQNNHNCKALTYWVDEERDNAFCLIEAPNKEAVRALHNNAHGLIPHEIIEVDPNVVNAFLGRINDPSPRLDESLNQIFDSAYRVIMVIESSNFLNRVESHQFTLFSQKFHNSVNKSIQKFDGRIVLLDNNSYLVSFDSVTNAVFCALKIQSNFKYITPKFDSYLRRLKIGLSIGAPVTSKKNLFEEAINLSTYMCEVIKEQVVLSSEIKKIYDHENHNAFLTKEEVRVLKPKEERFLFQLMEFINSRWHDHELTVEDFSIHLSYSRSQVYRKFMNLTGKSPNAFLRDFRLHRALRLLYDQKGNISEIAFESGFNSPAYFSKCFYEKYNILPSKYLQQHVY